jgi:beta-lactamase regulating signal transducer with metallopeptidase domain
MAKSVVRRFGIFRLVPMQEPQAFVFGFIKPKIYLSTGLLKKFDKNSLKTVIAHEKAHVARRDPLRRLLALIALVFHLPPAASEINQQLALIQELIADNAAAEKSGSRLNLAQLLVDFARLNLAGNAVGNISAFEFVNSNVEIRVRRLLDSDNKSAKVSLAAFAVAGVAIFFGVFVMSPKLHLLYEIILSIY